jgi:hypothetical protein
MTDSSIFAIRVAGADDDDVLRQISQLDSARPLQRPAAMAVVDGRPVAAMSLDDGRVVADPFIPTQHAVELLRARVGSASARRRRRRALPRIPRLRLA